MDWIAEMWDKPIAELEDFLTFPPNTEQLSTIMQFPVMSGQYYIPEGDEGHRKGLMLEDLRDEKNEFIFFKADKVMRKQTKWGTLQAGSKNWKKLSNEERRERLRRSFVSSICPYDKKKEALVMITEGKMGSQFVQRRID
jgi:hypothetical protein